MNFAFDQRFSRLAGPTGRFDGQNVLSEEKRIGIFWLERVNLAVAVSQSSDRGLATDRLPIPAGICRALAVLPEVLCESLKRLFVGTQRPFVPLER